MFAATAVTSALLERQATGRGRHLDITMFDSQVSMLSYLAAYYLASGEVPGPQGLGHMSIPTYRAFVCADQREIVVAANTEEMWRSLCDSVGLSNIASEPRFATNNDRLQNRHRLDSILEKAFLGLQSDHALKLLSDAGVPCAPINTVDKALASALVTDRQMVLELGDADGHIAKVVGNPIKSIGYQEPHQYPPRLGEHTQSILTSLLGMPVDVIAALESRGVIVIDQGKRREHEE
jgi:crotonobetainyl-CoA:carnitine CoA-transferase CaiB-like acyl-CoA transferase